jgi:hypothetical protein
MIEKMTLEDYIFNEEASSFEEFELKMLFTERKEYPIENVEMICIPLTN